MRIKTEYLLIFAGVVAGAFGGFMFWKHIGCLSYCSIQSVWYNSTAHGAIMGGLIFSMFPVRTKSSKDE